MHKRIREAEESKLGVNLAYVCVKAEPRICVCQGVGPENGRNVSKPGPTNFRIGSNFGQKMSPKLKN